MDSRIKGFTRGGVAVPVGADVEQFIDVSAFGDALVQQHGTEREELVRQGGSWVAQAAAAVAAVVAVPTTAALFTLWNGEDDGGKSLVIDSILCQQIGAPATAYQFGILAMLNRLRKAAPATPLVTPFSLSGVQTYPGKAVTMASETALVNDGWFSVGNSVQSTFAVGALPGTQIEVPINGRIIVRPGRRLNLSAIAQAVGVTVLLGCTFHERQLALGA